MERSLLRVGPFRTLPFPVASNGWVGFSARKKKKKKKNGGHLLLYIMPLRLSDEISQIRNLRLYVITWYSTPESTI